MAALRQRVILAVHRPLPVYPSSRNCRLFGFAVEGIGLGMIRTPKTGQMERAVLADFEWAAIRPFFQTSRVAFPGVDDRRVLKGIFYRAADVKEVAAMRRREARRITCRRATRRSQPPSSGRALPPS
jgi:hypothetical protein